MRGPVTLYLTRHAHILLLLAGHGGWYGGHDIRTLQWHWRIRYATNVLFVMLDLVTYLSHPEMRQLADAFDFLMVLLLLCIAFVFLTILLVAAMILITAIVMSSFSSAAMCIATHRCWLAAEAAYHGPQQFWHVSLPGSGHGGVIRPFCRREWHVYGYGERLLVSFTV